MPALTMDQVEKFKKEIKPNQDFFEHFTTGKLIGQGNMCEGVYECQQKLTEEKFAVKILNREKLKPCDKLKYQMEVEIL